MNDLPKSNDRTRHQHHRAAELNCEVVRELLVQADLSIFRAARLLDIAESVLRGYCMGDRVPRVVVLALERVAEFEQQAKTLRTAPPL